MNPLKCLISGPHSSDCEELLSCKMKVTAFQGNILIGGWRKLHSKQLMNLYSPTNAGMNKSWRINWAGHITQMEKCLLSFGQKI